MLRMTVPPAPADLPRRQLTEPESLRLLASYGVPTVPTIECTSLDDARAAAAGMGYPVVLKGIADNVAHKSDLGLVRVNLRDQTALDAAYQAIASPRVVVQAMIAGELEAIAGVTRADGVGLVVLAGLGGIHAETLRDVIMWPIPMAPEVIAAELGASTLGRVLRGPRWRHPGAEGAFLSLLLALQTAALSLGEALQAIDINPVILGASGATAVDALVIPRQ